MKKYLMLAVLCVVGCASSPKVEPVAAADTDSTITWGEFCKETGLAACYKGGACGLNLPSMGTCTNQFVQGCCGNKGVCNQDSGVLASQTKTCANALRYMSCADFNAFAQGNQNAIPSECTGVSK